MTLPINSHALPHSTHLLLYLIITTSALCAATMELLKGFAATPDESITTTFQPLLSDTTNNFSLGFLRVNQAQLALAVIHVPSAEPLWQATTTTGTTILARWDKRTKVVFNGSLVISDPHTGAFWSTDTDGDRVVVSDSSNLLIVKGDGQRREGSPLSSPLWQSFHFPHDTLVQNQNFTSAMTLVSSNELYTLRLGPDFFGLYAGFNTDKDQVYFKHTALEAKADVIEGNGPIYIRVNSDGWLGTYQDEAKPVDVEAFNSYRRNVPGILRLRLESDGNLKSYYWSGSGWGLDYQAITSPCELPSPCGSYGLCRPGHGCSCLENNTEARSGRCHPEESGDFCGSGSSSSSGSVRYNVLRRSGVELPFKELMGFIRRASLDECEKSCERNCTCWGALYSNSSGFCYTLDYPIQTILEVEDDTKLGYFKVRKGVGKNKMDAAGLGVGIGLLCGVGVVLVNGGAAVGFVVYKLKKGKERRVSRYLDEEDIAPVPYKDLGSSSSFFGSVELSNR